MTSCAAGAQFGRASLISTAHVHNAPQYLPSAPFYTYMLRGEFRSPDGVPTYSSPDTCPTVPW